MWNKVSFLLEVSDFLGNRLKTEGDIESGSESGSVWHLMNTCMSPDSDLFVFQIPF